MGARHTRPGRVRLQVVVTIWPVDTEEDIPPHRLTVSLYAPELGIETPALSAGKPFDRHLVGENFEARGPFRLVELYVQSAPGPYKFGTGAGEGSVSVDFLLLTCLIPVPVGII
jgi:hypothetical protein